MTDTQQSFPPQPAPPVAQQPAYQPGPTFAPEKPKRNVLGIIALAVAAVGFLFACIPGALIMGWVLLPIGFTLGIIAACLNGKVKWQALTAITTAVIGTIVGIIVFFAVVATSFSNAFGGTDVEIASGDDTSVVEEADAPAAEEAPVAEVGTRENPAALGSVVTGDEWEVTINSVTVGATDAVIAANSVWNEAPDAGTEYIVVNYTAKFTGTDPEGGTAMWASVEFVSADGVTFDGTEKITVAPDPSIDLMTTLYEGGAVTGNAVFQVPSPASGVIAVSPGMIADKVFVAIQ